MYKIGNDPVANKKIKIHHFYSFRVHHISTRNRLYIITLSESFDMGNEQFGTVDAVSRLGVDQRHAILGGKPTLQNVVAGIKAGKYKNILILCGAGISVSAGIPDFRSPKSGLYHNLQKYNLPTPESIFELKFFKSNPVPFFQLSREIYPSLFSPTPTHRFFELLEKKDMLLRVYTQNIDTLERLTGLSGSKIVECHGSYASNTCVECKETYSQEWMKGKLFGPEGVREEVPHCQMCGSGVVKPDITFFGEDLPQRFGKLIKPDLEKCDLLFVIGTSLQVFPVAGIVDKVSTGTPRVLINRDMVHTANCTGQKDDYGVEVETGDDGQFLVSTDGFWLGDEKLEKHNYRDVFLSGNCDDSIYKICDMLGWRDDLDVLVEAPEAGEGGGGVWRS